MKMSNCSTTTELHVWRFQSLGTLCPRNCLFLSSNTLSGLVEEVQGPVPAQVKKQGTYHKMTNGQQTAIGNYMYVAEHSNIYVVAVHHFSKAQFIGLKENYLAALKHMLMFSTPLSAHHLTHACRCQGHFPIINAYFVWDFGVVK